MSYQIIITEQTAANIVIDNNNTNVSVSTSEYPIVIEYNAVVEQAGGNAYGNANVAGFMASFGANTISTTGNITAGNISGTFVGSIANAAFANAAGVAYSVAGANVSGTVANATFATSAGSATTATTAATANAVAGANVTGTVANATFATSAATATTAGTVTSNAQANITSVGVLTSLSASGNITGNYILGNGSQLTGIAASYGNANVVANLAALGSNPVSTTGNITAGYVIGNGSALSAITGANVSGTVANATFATSAGSATTATTAATANAVAGANVSGTVANATFATSAATANTANTATFAGTANAVAGANVSGTVANATFATTAGTATSATTAGTVTTAAQANITSVGVLTSLSSTGNIDGANITGTHFGSGAALSSITGANVTGTVANATFATSAGTATSATTAATANSVAGANVSGTVANATFATSAGTATSATTAGTVTTAAQGNITSVGILTSLSASGNITGNYFLGNGSQLTGLPVQPGTYGNANVVANLAALGTNPVSTTGNVSAGYFVGNGSALSAITGANVSGTVANATFATSAGSATTAGQATVADTANAVTGANVSGQVSNALVAGTVYTAAQPNITSVGILTSLNTSGNISAAGNITGNVFTGNGAGLTNINAGNIVGSYGNANVANFLATYGSNTLSTTGTVTTGNLNVQSDAVITGNLTVNGNTTLVNSNVVTINDKFINVANNAATAAQANGGGLGVGPVGGEYATLTYNSTNNDWNTNIALSVSGNVTAGNFVGNGQYLSSITGANVSGTVANATFATSAGSANTANTATFAGTANAVAGANVSGTVANATFATSAGSATTAGSANTAATVTGNAQANITSVGILTSLSSTGNIDGANINGNGSGLSSITGANVTGTVANATFATSAGTANTANTATFANTANAVAGANVSGTVANATFATSAGSATTAGSANTAATVTSNAQANITSVGILTSLSVSGNVTANYFVGNGSQLTGLPAGYSNADVATLLAAFGSNSISTTGNITSGNSTVTTTLYASNITGAAGQNVTITADGTGDIHLDADSVRVGDNNSPATIVTHGTGNLILRTHEGDASQGNITLVNGANGNIQLNPNGTGLVTTTGISATGNIIANNASLTGNLNFGVVTVRNNNNRLFTDDAEFTNVDIGATLDVTGTVSATGNVTGNYFLGNGSQLTGITSSYGNANVAANLAAFGSNPISTTGNITAGYFVGNGSLLSNITAANVTGNVATANSAVFLKASTNAAVNMSIDAGNFQINLPGGSIINYGGDGDPNTIGSINLIGTQANLANSYAQLTFVNQANFFANPLSAMRVSNGGPFMFYDGLSSFGGAKTLGLGTNGVQTDTTFSAAGNITGANIRTAGQVSATGNVLGGNLIVTGNIVDTGALTISTGSNGNIALTPNGSGQVTASSAISATGNITGNYFVGNGSALTGITATSANSAVFLRASTNAAATMSIDNANSKIDLPGGGMISYFGFDAPTYGSIDIAAPQANIANSYVSFSHYTAANASATPVNICQVDITGVSAFYDAYNLHSGVRGFRMGASGLETINAPISASGNVTGANIRTAGSVSATGNVLGGNLIVTGNIIDTGALTIITGSNGNIALTPNGTGQVTASSAISATGNVTGGNILTVGAVSTTGRVIGANYTESVNAIGNSGGTVSPNISLGSIQTITLTSNLTFNTITNIVAGQSFTFIVTQDATGSRTLSSTMKFAGNSRTLSTAASSVDIISVFYDGSNYWASLTKGYA